MNEHEEIRRLQHQAKFNVSDYISEAEDIILGKINFDNLSVFLSTMINMDEIDGESLSR